LRGSSDCHQPVLARPSYKNPSSTKRAASIQSAGRPATVFIASAYRFTARGRCGFAATGRRVVVAHSEKRIRISSRERHLRDHAEDSFGCSGRAHCEFPRTAGILFTEVPVTKALRERLEQLQRLCTKGLVAGELVRYRSGISSKRSFNPRNDLNPRSNVVNS
jgi:methylphosphotriester-DNA--protein-cysteine methyltransferase